MLFRLKNVQILKLVIACYYLFYILLALMIFPSLNGRSSNDFFLIIRTSCIGRPVFLIFPIYFLWWFHPLCNTKVYGIGRVWRNAKSCIIIRPKECIAVIDASVSPVSIIVRQLLNLIYHETCVSMILFDKLFLA